MSGTTAKITGLVSTGGNALAAGATLQTKWNAPSGAPDEYRQDGRVVQNADGTRPTNPPWASWGRVTTPAFSKGGLANALYEVRVTARKAGSDLAGSTSDALAVRIGPAPTPTPAPAPTYATASDLAALASRVAALENAGLPAKLDALAARVTALENEPRVTPGQLKRVGASTATEELLVVRGGEIVVATRG